METKQNRNNTKQKHKLFVSRTPPPFLCPIKQNAWERARMRCTINYVKIKMFAVSCIKCETIFRIQLHGPIVEVKRWINGFFSLVFLLLAARTSFCLFLVRNTRVLFQMRHKCDVSMEACELCMFYLSPMLSILFFSFLFSSLLFRDTTPGWDLLILELLFSITLKSCDRTFILFSFYVEKKSLLFTLDNFYTTIWLKMVCMVSDKTRTSQKTPTETLWPNIFIEVDSDNRIRLTRSFFSQLFLLPM